MRSLKIEELELVAGGAPGGGGSTKQQNNGLGNGDQTAPGNSFPNNQAENNNGNAGGTGGNGFPVVPN